MNSVILGQTRRLYAVPLSQLPHDEQITDRELKASPNNIRSAQDTHFRQKSAQAAMVSGT